MQLPQTHSAAHPALRRPSLASTKSSPDAMASLPRLPDHPGFESLVQTHRKVPKGQPLYNAGAHFESLYIVRCGWFKSSLVMESGVDQIVGFHWHGDLMGLDGICDDHYLTSAVALTDADVWVIPFRRVAEMCRHNPAGSNTVTRMMSSEIVRNQQALMRMGTMNAEQRVMAFLGEVSGKLSRRGYSATCFVLPMTREEIGRYLGIQLETVSRVLGRLQRRGLLTITAGKQIELRRPAAVQVGSSGARA